MGDFSVPKPWIKLLGVKWYDIMIYTINWILRALWLVVDYNLSEYRRTADVIEKLLSLFCHGAQFWKCSRDYSGLSKLRLRKKFSRSCLRARKRRNRYEKYCWRLEKYLNWKKSSKPGNETRQVCNFPHFPFLFILYQWHISHMFWRHLWSITEQTYGKMEPIC